MKIEYVLTASTADEFYCDFIPIFVESWKKLFPDCTTSTKRVSITVGCDAVGSCCPMKQTLQDPEKGGCSGKNSVNSLVLCWPS